MCKRYSKIPVQEESWSEEENSHKADSNKWKKVKKAAIKVCDFLFGDFYRLSATEPAFQPVAYTAAYAVAMSSASYW